MKIINPRLIFRIFICHPSTLLGTGFVLFFNL